MENPKIINRFLLYAFALFSVAVVMASLYLWNFEPVIIWAVLLIILLGIGIVYAIVFGPLMFFLGWLFSHPAGTKKRNGNP